MNLREYLLTEETYGLTIIDSIKQYKNDDVYVIFSDIERPKQDRLKLNFALDGVAAFPIKWVYNTLKRNELLNIPKWTIKKYIIIAAPLRGKTLNINEFNKDKTLLNLYLSKLRKFYIKNCPVKTKDPNKNWISLEQEINNWETKDAFRKLIKAMKFINRETSLNLNVQFQYLGYTSILSPIGFSSLMTNNPEMIFLNSKNIKYIKSIDNS